MNPDQDKTRDTLIAERDRASEKHRIAAGTMERWGLLIVAATRSYDLVDSHGQGDWQAVEHRLAELRHVTDQRDRARDLAARLEQELAHLQQQHDRLRDQLWSLMQASDGIAIATQRYAGHLRDAYEASNAPNAGGGRGE